MPTIDATLELLKLLLFMLFVTSLAAQVWIVFLDIAEYFTKTLNQFRPKPSQDKYSRMGLIVIGGIVLAFN
ncbi:MAG: hypothetical protein GW906_02175 [Epsilonproteobacteria bacterium]|nr:hypothetical protein [Campylobacterota bacterium]OIO14749.1 MAG: hypothetical protein AUJ81_08750 [Helicobacteraceae bacterium CG1_02_36_14]PIP09190.1 MAG: hypothetical protein COX50_12230 [Sulfurimonas sp. CG23_combo_of_CG06-09_8_20_14_all_36_33]PIS25118.1 MAG: hypothetical protein COT46_07055 [Sulfurimonas sp. CG08_land_8_20_14_0_20_36_33]PIU34621.1 MAG: hypothetical protein COT05_06810 [Sulfurimonas sp. CG07_land_8_20_14_0_80_36_56]PIV04450.1 MAG: hypothetical protein COS56_04800 [Sulfur